MAQKVKRKDKSKAITSAGEMAAPLVVFEKQLANLEQILADLDMQLPRVDVLDKGRRSSSGWSFPGVKQENVEMAVADRSVTIKASNREEKKKEKARYVQCEIVTRSYMRTIPLSAEVAGTKAKVKDGILHVVLPKAGKRSDAQKVEVR
jgi:HSP20 family molecular chaperone IbpA